MHRQGISGFSRTRVKKGFALVNMVFVLNPNNRVIKRLWRSTCTKVFVFFI